MPRSIYLRLVEARSSACRGCFHVLEGDRSWVTGGIAANFMDRFLTQRVVSLQKFWLISVTAIFIAANVVVE